jgi:Flp pilus assembly protein CpaB
MEVHQTEFLQAVALAGAVALAMTVWDTSGQEARVHAAGAQARSAGTQYTGVNRSHVAVAARKVEVQP